MGAHLVAIENGEEENWIQNEGVGDKWWTAGTDVDSEGSWYWAHSNNTMNYTNWSAYQPNGGSHENCAATDGGKLHDYQCSAELYFICEK
ncbi:perlucin-like protein [Ostrea edulis]|uniref:perlucin-like protein n=1 Tax=Ostrea edulis TaxID=37623 RepID=UPI002095C214|nr:perlucin-like protein [Ostrea edulis]